MRGGRIDVDLGTAVIEEDADVWIAEGCFDDSRVERGAADRVDVVARVGVVGREMQVSGLIVDHPAGHWDRVLENFIGDPKLLERVNAASGEREIDRAAADDVPFPRIGASLVKFDIVAAPAEISGEKSTGQPAPDENKFRHGRRIGESGKQESRKKLLVWQWRLPSTKYRNLVPSIRSLFGLVFALVLVSPVLGASADPDKDAQLAKLI